jgi:predicted ATPase with chaperone activity
MKSIKIIAVAALCTLAFSCKKEAKTVDQMAVADSAQATTVVDAMAQQQAPEEAEMLKEAQSKPLTTIAFSETDHNFGDIKKGEKVEHIYEVTNTGTNPLIISNVKPGCGCTVPDFTKEPILPGKKGKITLHFDSTNFDGAVNKAADVFVNVEKAPVKLTFSANITQ